MYFGAPFYARLSAVGKMPERDEDREENDKEEKQLYVHLALCWGLIMCYSEKKKKKERGLG